jgi:hypothetical protein
MVQRLRAIEVNPTASTSHQVADTGRATGPAMLNSIRSDVLPRSKTCGRLVRMERNDDSRKAAPVALHRSQAVAAEDVAWPAFEVLDIAY